MPLRGGRRSGQGALAVPEQHLSADRLADILGVARTSTLQATTIRLFRMAPQQSWAAQPYHPPEVSATTFTGSLPVVAEPVVTDTDHSEAALSGPPVTELPVTELPATELPVTELPVTELDGADAGVAAAKVSEPVATKALLVPEVAHTGRHRRQKSPKLVLPGFVAKARRRA